VSQGSLGCLRGIDGFKFVSSCSRVDRCVTIASSNIDSDTRTTLLLAIVCLPNEDLGKWNNRSGVFSRRVQGRTSPCQRLSYQPLKCVVPARAPTDSARLVDVRYSALYFLAGKNHKMHIAHLDRFRSVGRCAIFGFVFLGRKNHKMHIAYLDRFRSVGRDVRCQCQFVLKGVPGRVKGRTRPCWPEKSQDAYRTSRRPNRVLTPSQSRTSRPIPFGWSMCDIRLCISCWPEHKPSKS
jgi:hypothetical protein